MKSVYSVLSLLILSACISQFEVAPQPVASTAPQAVQEVEDIDANLTQECKTPFDWEGATGESSSMQIIQTPDDGFDYEKEYAAIYANLGDATKELHLDRLTEPVVILSYLTSYTRDNFIAGDMSLAFGVPAGILALKFSDLWLGALEYPTVAFEFTRGHACADSFKAEFKEKNTGVARLILESDGEDDQKGLLIRMWYSPDGESKSFKPIGYTWIDKLQLMQPARYPANALRADQWLSQQTITIAIIIALTMIAILISVHALRGKRLSLRKH